MDRLILKGLRYQGRHGVETWERRVGQPFIVDLVLHLDLAPAGSSDSIASTVNYAQVYQCVREVVQGPPCRLIERVAEKIGVAVLSGFAPVRGVEVTVHKPHAPIGGDMEWVACCITRWRDGGAQG